MEKGNEGDEIILFSFQQINCSIPSEIKKVSQITADILVDIIIKSLFLISDGNIQVSFILYHIYHLHAIYLSSIIYLYLFHILFTHSIYLSIYP